MVVGYFLLSGCKVYNPDLIAELDEGANAGRSASQSMPADIIGDDISAGHGARFVGDAGGAGALAERNVRSGAWSEDFDDAGAPSQADAAVDCAKADSAAPAGGCGCRVTERAAAGAALDACAVRTAPGFHRRLTFDHTLVAATLSDFPVLVRMVDAHLGVFAAASGSDIYFLARDERSMLDYEIESFEPTTGTLVAWVRVPRLDSEVDPVIYLGYGDGGPARSNAKGVWSGHHYVWHLNQDPGVAGAEIEDSTGRAAGRPLGGMASECSVDAVAGKGLAFDGVDDHVSFDNDVTGAGPTTIEAWVKQLPRERGLGSAIVSFGNQATNQARFLLSFDDAKGTTKVGFYNNDVSGPALELGSWNHLVWVWDGSATRVYLNGTLAQRPSGHSGAMTAGSAGNLGDDTFSSRGLDFFLHGELDEVRVSTAARSGDWVLTEYNNQRPSSKFLERIDPPMRAP